RKGRVKTKEEEKEQPLFPDTAPAQGPVASLVALLKALGSKDFDRARSLMAEKRDPEKLVWDLEKGVGKTAGIQPGEIAAKFLPSLQYLPGKCGYLELGYRFPLTAGGEKGVVHVRWEAFIEGRGEAPAWVTDDLAVTFHKDDKAGEPGNAPEAPKGLWGIHEAFPIWEVGGFPEGTKEIALRCKRAQGGWVVETGAEFQVRDGALILAYYKGKVRGRVEEKSPPVIPQERPEVSLRNFLKALVALDEAGVFKYLPARKKERMAKRGRGFAYLKEDLERGEAREGFSIPKVMLANLPKTFGEAGKLIGVEMGYVFPGEAKGKGGRFEIGFALHPELQGAGHWVVEDTDVDFREKKD
ncbi:MAG: hypothetical protein ACYTHN_18755, partial [Planctomycetota bacterium]